jgi:hypothetical protein
MKNRILLVILSVCYLHITSNAQVNQYKIECSENTNVDSVFTYKGIFTVKIIPEKKEVVLTKKYDPGIKWGFSEPVTDIIEKFTYRRQKDTLIDGLHYNLFFLTGDPDMISQPNLEYKFAISPTKSFYFNGFFFTTYSATNDYYTTNEAQKNVVPKNYMLKSNRQLAKLGRKPSSFIFYKDEPRMRSKEEAAKDENQEKQNQNKINPVSSLEEELNCLIPLIYPIYVNSQFNGETVNEWQKKNKALIDEGNSISKLALPSPIGTVLVSGNLFKIIYDDKINTLSWTDKISSALYSNKEFEGLNEVNHTDPPLDTKYNPDWELINSNSDQSERTFRNCMHGLIVIVSKSPDNLCYLITMKHYTESERNTSSDFINCLNPNEKYYKYYGVPMPLKNEKAASSSGKENKFDDSNSISYFEDCIIKGIKPSGSGVQTQYDQQGFRAIVWNDAMIKSYKYSNELFDQLGYEVVPSDYKDKKAFRNCKKGILIEIGEWNGQLSITMSWFDQSLKKQNKYFMFCK